MDVIDAYYLRRGIRDVGSDGFRAVCGGREMPVGNLPSDGPSLIIEIVKEKVLVEVLRSSQSGHDLEYFVLGDCVDGLAFAPEHWITGVPRAKEEMICSFRTVT